MTAITQSGGKSTVVSHQVAKYAEWSLVLTWQIGYLFAGPPALHSQRYLIVNPLRDIAKNQKVGFN